jgi:branched-chain amino acid transport system substrate-binding protein
MRRLLLAVLMVAALTAGCAGAGATSRTIAIGGLYPVTGPQANAGVEEERGVRLAVDWVNDHGGVHGKKIRLVTADAPTPESAGSALRTLLNRGVDVVFGSHSSAVSSAVASATRHQRVTFFETGAVGHIQANDVAGRTFFRLAPMGANLGRAAIGFVSDQLYPGRPLRWAVAHVDDVYGSAVGDGAVAEIGRRGATLAGSIAYDPHTFDANGVAAQLAGLHPDALFVSAYLDDGVALRKATAASPMKLLAEIGTSSSYCHPAFGAALGDTAVGLFASDKPDAADVNPNALTADARKALAWVAPRYQTKYHDAMSAPALSGFSGALAILGHVLPKARTTSAGAVRDAALRVRLPEGSLPNGSGLALAPAGAPDAGDNRNASSVIWEWVAPRTRAVVWPPAFATAAIKR